MMCYLLNSVVRGQLSTHNGLQIQHAINFVYPWRIFFKLWIESYKSVFLAGAGLKHTHVGKPCFLRIKAGMDMIKGDLV